MIRKFNLSIFIWDEVLDAVLVERSVLGPQIRLSERLPRSENTLAELSEKITALEINELFITLSIPRENVLLRTLTYPAMVEENLATMLPLEANRHLPLPENDRAVAWTSAKAGEKLLLEMVASKQSAIDKILEPFAETGIEPDYVLPASAFISRWTGEEATLVLICDAQHIEICLCNHGLIRESVQLKEPKTEQVVDNAQRMMARNRAWLGDEGIARITSAGPIALADSLQNQLSVAFGLTAQPLAALEEVDEAEKIEAVRAALEELPEALNLIEARKRKFTMSRRTITITSLAAILLIQLIVWPILYAQAPKASEARLNRKIRSLKKSSSTAQKMNTEIRQMRDELSNLEALSKDQLSMMHVLQITSDTLPEDSYLTRIQFDKIGQMKLSGRSKNVAALSSTLLKIPFVKDILKSENKERSNSEYSEFAIIFTLKDMNNE